MEVIVNHIDTCCPYYFEGSSYPVLAIMLWHGITYRQLYLAVIDEFESVDIGLWEKITKQAFKTALDECFHYTEQLNFWDNVFFTLDQSELDEDGEPLTEDYEIYAYFSIEVEE